MAPILQRRAGRAGLALALVALVAVWPASIAAGNGNNGTVKVHEGALATDTAPEIRNEPHVCTFHLHFFFADGGQTGSWSIDQQSPTGSDTAVLEGSYTAANGEFATVEYGLPIGHYKLYWDGRNEQNQKHKTFWVTCENPAGPIDTENDPN